MASDRTGHHRSIGRSPSRLLKRSRSRSIPRVSPAIAKTILCIGQLEGRVRAVVQADLDRYRLEAFIQAQLASVVALFNGLLTLFHQLHPDADPLQMSIAEFSL